MKLVTCTIDNQVRLGRVDAGMVTPFDLPGGMLGLIQSGTNGLETARGAGGPSFPLDNISLAEPLNNPSKIIAIGLNYADHASEGKVTAPERPLTFAKFPSCLVGPGAEVHWSPWLTGKVDYEAELVVVIGRRAFQVPEHAALDYVFGYTCGNDISARDIQFSDGQWVRAKSLDTFGPLGPWIVTADDIPNPQTLDIRMRLNGQMMQESSTAHMIFSVAHLIHFLSQAITLLPGDLIYSGTPSGVGNFRTPPMFLRDGDEMQVEISRIGVLVNHCRTLAEESK